MDSPKDLMAFDKAVEYMDSIHVTDFLQKISDFLKKNNHEIFFPNISAHEEAFLVNLVKDTRNLKHKSINSDPENKNYVLEIIDTLEINREVFRWTYTYENGKTNKNLLVYKKIFTNKIKMKPAELKKPPRLSQRLLQAQSFQKPAQTPNSSAQTISKTQLLNMTLRFIKNDAELILNYPEMPLDDAQYIYSLIKHPKGNLNVGFGYKSMSAPLYQAMDAYGDDYKFKIDFVETGKCETVGLKFEKIRRKNATNTSKDDSSVASSSSSAPSRKRKDKLNGVTVQFVKRTLKALLAFTRDGGRASVTFDKLADDEMAFIRGVKALAASVESYGVFEPFRPTLLQLHRNVTHTMLSSKIRVEEGQHKRIPARFITLKKVPRETEPAASPTSAVEPTTRSRSAVSAKSTRDRSLSKERKIAFKSAGQLLKDNLKPGQTASLPPASPPPAPAPAPGPAPAESTPRGRSAERLNKRKTKLLEDMSTPIESDIGLRMMRLMGWSGGALGARGDGILEPLVPTIELPAGAGLGHVPPPKAERAKKTSAEFRAAVLRAVRDLLLHEPAEKRLEYKTEISLKEKRFVNNTLQAFNKRKVVSLSTKVETELLETILAEMNRDPEIQVLAEIASDFKQITLSKSNVKTVIPMLRASKKQKEPITPIKPPKLEPKDKTKNVEPIVMTVLNTNREYEYINEDCIDRVVTRVIPSIDSACKTPVAIRARAIRILFLMRFIEFAKCLERMEREFRFEGTMQKKLVAFLEDIVSCVNLRVRSGFVTPEELPWFEELLAAAELFYLNISFDSGSKFILKKKQRNLTQYQRRFTNSSMLTMNNNNDLDTYDQNLTKDNWAKEENEISEPINIKDKNEAEDKPAKVELEEETEQTEVEYYFIDCDIEHKINEVDKNDKGVETVIVKEEPETDNKTNDKTDDTTDDKTNDKTDDKTSEDSLCVCDNKVDISELDKDIQDLELAINEADISFIKEDDDEKTSSKRSRCSSVISEERDTKRSKITQIDNILIITTKNNEDIDTDVVKKLQMRILKDIENSDNFLPLFKCFGIQNGRLVYSCHDENDIAWLEKIIGDLDLKINKPDDDFVLDRKSRKLVMKINSFIPLDSKKVFRNIELYNDGLFTSKWKVVVEKTDSDSVIFILEVDEKSFKYISQEDFALYIGIDKAQFSIIS